jgi:DNA repair exonuclease SbcCD ATPase subunit
VKQEPPKQPPAQLAADLKSAEDNRKAKTRLETICKLLGTPQQSDNKLKARQEDVLAALFDEIVYSQSNKYDAQSLRLLMDMQWQNINSQTAKLQDELTKVKAELEQQQKKTKQSQQVYEELQTAKNKLREQDKLIGKYEQAL